MATTRLAALQLGLPTNGHGGTEVAALAGCVLPGTVEHLPDTEHDQLTVGAMSTGAVTTSEIEGEALDRAGVQSAIRRQLGLEAGHQCAAPVELDVTELIVDLCRSYAATLTKRCT